MNPEERRLRIIDYVERYEAQKDDFPTIREIVKGSGASYAEINSDIEALIGRGLLLFVQESVVGSEPFSARQVKTPGRAPGSQGNQATRIGGIRRPDRAADEESRRAPWSGSKQASTSQQMGHSADHRLDRSQTRIMGQSDSTSRSSQSRSGPSKPGRSQSEPRSQTPYKPAVKKKFGSGRPKNPKRIGAGKAIPRGSNAEPMRPLLKYSLLGALLGALLILIGLFQDSPIRVEPSIGIASYRLPITVVLYVLGAGLLGLILGHALEKKSLIGRESALQAMVLGAIGTAAYLFWTQFEVPAWFEPTGLPRIIEAMALSLPVLLPFALIRRPGATALGAFTGIILIILQARLAGNPIHLFTNYLLGLTPSVLPLEGLALLPPKKRELSTLVTAGLLAGIGTTIAGMSLTPGAMSGMDNWIADLIVNGIAGALAGLILSYSIAEWQARRSSSKSKPKSKSRKR